MCVHVYACVCVHVCACVCVHDACVCVKGLRSLQCPSSYDMMHMISVEQDISSLLSGRSAYHDGRHSSEAIS